MSRYHSEHRGEEKGSRTSCHHVIRITIEWVERESLVGKASPEYNQHQMTSTHRATIDHKGMSNHVTPNPCNKCYLWHLSRTTCIKLPNYTTVSIISSTRMIVFIFTVCTNYTWHNWLCEDIVQYTCPDYYVQTIHATIDCVKTLYSTLVRIIM